jgi:hypothetical protein
MVDAAAPPVVNNNTTINNTYNFGDRSATDSVTVGTIEGLPPGTTDMDVALAISNGTVQALIDLIEARIEADPNMDPAMKEYLLGQIEKLQASIDMSEVSPEVQAAVDAEYGEYNTAMAQTIMDMLMEQFEEMASEERTAEARNTDSDETSTEEGTGGAANWMIQLAKALADIQSKWLDNLMASYEKMQEHTTAAPGADASQEEKDAHAEDQKAFIQAQAEVTAYARLFGMASEVTANVIKSLGDGLTSVARKQ